MDGPTGSGGSVVVAQPSPARRRSPAMDPLHITEFASERYFEKLSQSSAQQGEPYGEGVATATQQPLLQKGLFILPLRGANFSEADDFSKPVDHKRSDKGRFFGLRSKFHHTKPQATSAVEPLERRRSVSEPCRCSVPFDQLFQWLPIELQVQIIFSLPLSDILAWRLVSRSFHVLITLNEGPIVRHHLHHHVPAYAKRLYPLPRDAPLTFHYFCGIWHRLHVVAKLSDLMCEWITKEIFLRKSTEQRAEFEPQRERMRRRLIPLLFTIFHFFEKYRELHLKYLTENDGMGLLRKPYTFNPIEAEIMKMYDDQTLLRVHQIFPLVISSFCRRLRPPSYVGRVEGTLRGYLREKPADEVHAAILCIGGLREVERLWEIKGYNTRRAEVDHWYHSLGRTATLGETEGKKRRVMLGLGRRKSTVATTKAPAVDTGALQCHRGSWHGTPTTCSSSDAATSFVFNTSLAAGRPMSAICPEQSRMLLSDLPVLQNIWLHTAEALILDRKIVERSTDIKRNAQVMLDLIREDGFDEEDQWWYGTMAPASVKPNLEAIQEDTED